MNPFMELNGAAVLTKYLVVSHTQGTYRIERIVIEDGGYTATVRFVNTGARRELDQEAFDSLIEQSVRFSLSEGGAA